MPIWNGRVSPLLDTAERLTVVDKAAAGPGERLEVELLSPPLSRRASQIAELGLDLLACGAVSRTLSEMLDARGVRITPWLAGDAEEIIDALASGDFEPSLFMMPGCGCGRGRGRRRGARMQRRRGRRRG